MTPLSRFRSVASTAILLCAFVAATPGFAQDTLQIAANADERQFLADADAMLASGQSRAAYTLLSTREAELAGNPYYDYLLGVAALDSGRYERNKVASR